MVLASYHFAPATVGYNVPCSAYVVEGSYLPLILRLRDQALRTFMAHSAFGETRSVRVVTDQLFWTQIDTKTAPNDQGRDCAPRVSSVSADCCIRSQIRMSESLLNVGTLFLVVIQSYDRGRES